MKGWYEIENVDALDTPALVVYPDRVDTNIQTLMHMVDNVNNVRPHVKTHKNPEVTNRLLAAGITRFKCATIAEAEMLAQCGAPDILLAYQPVGPKIKRLIALILHYPGVTFGCLADQPAAAKQINEAASVAGVRIHVYIDLNVGMNRTGIAPGEEALLLYKTCAAYAHLNVMGLHAYDGHIRDEDFEIRKQRCDEQFRKVEKLAAAIAQSGLPAPVIIAGGSPTFSIHCKRKHIQCSPGTFIYWDAGYAALCPEQSFLPAAVLVTRVISLPATGMVCTDLGHKSVAAENDISKRVDFMNAGKLMVRSQSEEHLVFETESNHRFKPGDVLYGLPYHICPTVALYESVISIEKGKVSGEWMNVARDRKIKN